MGGHVALRDEYDVCSRLPWPFFLIEQGGGSFHEILRTFSSDGSPNDASPQIETIGAGLAPLPIPHETVSDRIAQGPQRNFNDQTNEK